MCPFHTVYKINNKKPVEVKTKNKTMICITTITILVISAIMIIFFIYKRKYMLFEDIELSKEKLLFSRV